MYFHPLHYDLVFSQTDASTTVEVLDTGIVQSRSLGFCEFTSRLKSPHKEEEGGGLCNYMRIIGRSVYIPEKHVPAHLLGNPPAAQMLQRVGLKRLWP